MSQSIIVGLWLVFAILAANLPWMSERVFFVFAVRHGAKPARLRIVEWFVLYGLTVGIGFGFEYRVTGTVHSQDWEFYVVTLCLLIVAAMPGFVYRHQLKPLLERAR